MPQEGKLEKREVYRGTGDEALEVVLQFLLQQDVPPDRFIAWDKLARIVASERALKRKVKRQSGQILELQATIRRLSRYGGSPPGRAPTL